MLALFARRPCHSRLLSLRYLASEAVSTTTAEAGSPASADEASTSAEIKPATGLVREPAWWHDTTVDATRAYRIIMNRFRVHGSQREENYRQLVSRVKTPHDAGLALTILDQGRTARAVLQQHTPYTFHTSQMFIEKCVAVKAFDTALEALQRAQEIGLQFFRGGAYFAVMKGAVVNKQLDIAIKVFEAMKENGVRPGGKVVHSLIMGSIINGRRDLAEAYAEEFRYNGVKINKASEEWLEGIRTPDEGKDELGTPQDADSGGAPSGEQEKTAAVTSA
ncbi:hypothetical protein ABBQ32_009749 [Trebouxia sp. C0010 RCD-2024]